MSETIDDLLSRWKAMRIILIQNMQKDYGENSPVNNQVMMVMEKQLSECIKELEAVLANRPFVDLLAKTLVKSLKENNGEAQS